jgi:two-component system phosphate regulon response regulator PhoB
MSSSRTILVVENEVPLRETLSMLLEDAGYRVLQADDGEQAFCVLHECAGASMVLLDWSMPGMDGREFLERLRASSRWADLPVAVMTGAPERDFPGANTSVQKPFDLPELLLCLSGLVADSHRTE